MNDKKYLYCARGLCLAFVFITLISKIPAVNGYFRLLPFQPYPVIWGIIILLMIFVLPANHVPGRLRQRGYLWASAFSGGFLYLSLRFGAGFILKEISLSPYDHSIRGILGNFFLLFPALVAQEMIRAHLIGFICRSTRFPRFWLIAIALVFCIPEINFSKILILKDGKEWFIFISKDLLPLLAQSSLLTVLAYCGTERAAIAFSGTIAAFTRLFPFLPSLPWIADSAFGIIFPVIMALYIWEKYQTLIQKQPVKQEGMVPFVISLVLVIAFSWFTTGVFPVYPSVILTGSMEPGILPGDIVLIEKFTSEQEIYQLKVDDVINFKREDIVITHRIISVLYDEAGNISFETKGDNNKTADDVIVKPSDLNGIVKTVIPKAGIFTLWMRGSDPLPEGVVDDK